LDWLWLTPPVVIAVGSLVTAICSFFVALFNFRRSNHPVVRVLGSSAAGGVAVDRGPYTEFKVVFRNFGIPLHNIGVVLQFNPEPGGFGGWVTVPMKTEDGECVREGQFAKGASVRKSRRRSEVERGCRAKKDYDFEPAHCARPRPARSSELILPSSDERAHNACKC
jgi:hypothetical protein